MLERRFLTIPPATVELMLEGSIYSYSNIIMPPAGSPPRIKSLRSKLSKLAQQSQKLHFPLTSKKTTTAQSPPKDRRRLAIEKKTGSAAGKKHDSINSPS